jgi:RNA polymerase sigma factor for flagellar operon FliA
MRTGAAMINSTPSTKPAEVGNSQSERDRLVLEHLPLVRAIAVRVYENLPVHLDLDDLVHAGIMGLLDAAVKYDDNKQVSFKSYAKHRIKGAILDSLRGMDWASRDLRKRHKKLEAIQQEMAASMDRTPTEEEIAQKMGMNVERWRQVAVDLRMVGLMSASSRPADNENQNAPEFPAGSELNPDTIAGKNQLTAVLNAAMSKLPERHRAVIHMYYTESKTMREIGDALGINESRVSQIHRAALEKMAENLQASGIHSAECVL